MPDDLTFDPGLDEVEDERWQSAIVEMAEANGWHEPLGERHHAIHIDRGPSLVVTFERIDEIQEAAPGAEPAGIAIARRTGRSALTILSERRTWFRDEAVYDLFDRLVDDGFFDEFDDVLFYGTGPDCGYAACAFSVAAPGARVLTLAPMATGNPRVAGWDTRHPEARRLDFTSRYGFAPEMIDGADRVCVVHDPELPLDAMHAALFERPNVDQKRMRHFGKSLDVALHRLGLWDDVIEGVAEGTLTDLRFARMMRARRHDFHYLRALGRALDAKGRRRLQAIALRTINEDKLVEHRFFRRTAKNVAERMEAEDDAPLPPRRGSPEADLDAEAI